MFAYPALYPFHSSSGQENEGASKTMLVQTSPKWSKSTPMRIFFTGVDGDRNKQLEAEFQVQYEGPYNSD